MKKMFTLGLIGFGCELALASTAQAAEAVPLIPPPSCMSTTSASTGSVSLYKKLCKEADARLESAKDSWNAIMTEYMEAVEAKDYEEIARLKKELDEATEKVENALTIIRKCHQINKKLMG